MEELDNILQNNIDRNYNQIGLDYYFGKNGKNIDYMLAKDNFLKVEDQEFYGFWFLIGDCYLKESEYKYPIAQAYFENAINLDRFDKFGGKYGLALMYIKGLCINKDLIKAKELIDDIVDNIIDELDINDYGFYINRYILHETLLLAINTYDDNDEYKVMLDYYTDNGLTNYFS